MKPFRYRIKARTKINCFEPKPLSASDATDLMTLRASVFGGAFIGQLDKLGAGSTLCQTLWEAQGTVPELF